MKPLGQRAAWRMVKPWREEWYERNVGRMTIETLERNMHDLETYLEDERFSDNEAMHEDAKAAWEITQAELTQKVEQAKGNVETRGTENA